EFIINSDSGIILISLLFFISTSTLRLRNRIPHLCICLNVFHPVIIHNAKITISECLSHCNRNLCFCFNNFCTCLLCFCFHLLFKSYCHCTTFFSTCLCNIFVSLGLIHLQNSTYI